MNSGPPTSNTAPFKRFAGLVLAGGQSRRMGQDKAGLHWQGATLLEHQCGLLRAAGADPVLVSAHREGGLADRQPGLGPLGGLDTAFARLPDGWLLVIAVDTPRLQPGHFARLLAETRHASAVYFAGYPLPCLLHVDQHARQSLATRLPKSGRERSLRAFLNDLGARELPLQPGDEQALRGCNTQEEWRALGDSG